MERSSTPDSSSDAPFGVSDSLAPPRINKAAGITTLDFDGLLKNPLQLKEDLKDGCGGQLWAAGMILARYLLLRHSVDLAGKTILELGAGGGLVGLAVARGCKVGLPIHITDQQPMLSLMQENIRLNHLQSAVVASILNWGEPVPDQIPSHPDIILAADCVYFEPAYPLLIATLHHLLGPKSVCFFCFKRRRRADLRFMKMAKRAFDIQEVGDDSSAPTYNRENLFLYTIRIKSARNTKTSKGSQGNGHVQ